MVKKKNKSKKPVKSDIVEAKKSTLITSTISPLQKLFILGIFSVIGLVQYLQTLPYEYVLDDIIVITDNIYTQKGIAGINDLLANESFVGYFKEQKNLIPGARYRPLSMITFAIEHDVFGPLNSRVSHLINIILYILTGFLLFLSLDQLFPSKRKWFLGIAFLASMLWMTHAVHTEVVANIKGRDEILSLFFSLITLLLSFRYLDTNKLKFVYLPAIAISFFMGLLAKENTITFLAIIPISIYFFREVSWKKYIPIILPILISIIGYLILRKHAVGFLYNGLQSQDLMNNPFVDLTGSQSFGMIFYVLLKYLGLSFVPYPLTHDYYPYQIPQVEWYHVIVLVSVLIHSALAVIAFRLLSKKNIWSFIIFFYAASLSIYSNIVINIGTTMNERFLFVPTIASCIAIVYFFSLTAKKMKKTWIKIAGVSVFALMYLAISINRVPVWKNTLTLNEAAVKVSTNSARANSFMGTALFNKAMETDDSTEKLKLLEQGMSYQNKSVDLFPKYHNGNLMKAGTAGQIYQLDRDINKLLKSFYEVASQRPEIPYIFEFYDYIADREPIDLQVQYYKDLASKELIPKRFFEFALKHLNYGYKLNPNDAELNLLISQAYQGLGKTIESNQFLNKARQLDPTIK